MDEADGAGALLLVGFAGAYGAPGFAAIWVDLARARGRPAR